MLFVKDYLLGVDILLLQGVFADICIYYLLYVIYYLGTYTLYMFILFYINNLQIPTDWFVFYLPLQVTLGRLEKRLFVPWRWHLMLIHSPGDPIGWWNTRKSHEDVVGPWVFQNTTLEENDLMSLFFSGIFDKRSFVWISFVPNIYFGPEISNISGFEKMGPWLETNHQEWSTHLRWLDAEVSWRSTWSTGYRIRCSWRVPKIWGSIKFPESNKQQMLLVSFLLWICSLRKKRIVWVGVIYWTLQSICVCFWIRLDHKACRYEEFCWSHWCYLAPKPERFILLLGFCQGCFWKKTADVICALPLLIWTKSICTDIYHDS